MFGVGGKTGSSTENNKEGCTCVSCQIATFTAVRSRSDQGGGRMGGSFSVLGNTAVVNSLFCLNTMLCAHSRA